MPPPAVVFDDSDDDADETTTNSSSTIPASAPKSVWIGTASRAALSKEEVDDVSFSRLGGLPVLFREEAAGAPCPLSRCNNCSKSTTVRLVAQIYAPIDTNDRVLYLMHCEACSTETRAHLFAFRSVNANLEQHAALTSQIAAAKEAAAIAAEEEKAPLFEETDDWGDDDSAVAEIPALPVRPHVVPAEEPLPAAAPEPMRVPVQHRLAECGAVPPNAAKKAALPLIALDMFEDASDPTLPGANRQGTSRRGRGAAPSAEDQLRDLEHTRGTEAVDRDSVEEDDETDGDKALRKYVKYLTRYPSQCVRWCANAAPLLCRVDELPPTTIPPCSSCGGSRRFECQVFSTAIFFLMTGVAEAAHSLHFGTVLLYTCSNDCDDAPYAAEYCFVQSEV